MFYFESISAALFMEGHGFYVWLSYCIGLVVILLNVWFSRAKYLLIRRQVKLELMDEGLANGKPSSNSKLNELNAR